MVDCEHNPNALQLALINPQAGATLQIKGVCFGNFVINTDLKLIGLDNAVLDGHDAGTTVTFNNARVELRNLTILHGRAGSDAVPAGQRVPTQLLAQSGLPSIRLTDHAADLNASTAPPSPAAAVEYLRTESISMIFDPTARTLTADTPRRERSAIG
ncbi:hypothetical protein ACWCY6_39515 [Streptomyces sp. 900105755]